MFLKLKRFSERYLREAWTKKRTNAEVREVFKKEIKGFTDEWGLTIPSYDESAQPI